MSLTTPILYSIPAFDALNQQNFTFNVIGGDQVVKNKLTIKKQSDDSLVYENEQVGFSYLNVVTPNHLINGEYYYAYVNTYNSNGDISEDSNRIQFYCYTTPLFNITNIPSSRLINNSSYNFIIEYNQIENEKLESYIFNLYNVQNTLIATSGVMYVGDTSSLPLNISYIFSELDNNTRYYIQAIGTTEENTQILTELEYFYVQYIQPNIFSIVELNNNCDGGYITVKSNFSEIDGKSSPDPPIYTDNNEAVDVTGVGDYILWDEGFSINNDFTASLWGHNFNENSKIITFKNDENYFYVNYKNYNEYLKYVELIVKNNNVIYYIYSNPIVVLENDKLQIWIRRVNELYEISLYDLEERNPLILNSSENGILNSNSLS